MNEGKAREQLVEEMAQMRQWISEFVNSGSNLTWMNESMEKNVAFLGAVLNLLPNPFYVIDAYDYTVKAANSAAQFVVLSKDSTCMKVPAKRSIANIQLFAKFIIRQFNITCILHDSIQNEKLVGIGNNLVLIQTFYFYPQCIIS